MLVLINIHGSTVNAMISTSPRRGGRAHGVSIYRVFRMGEGGGGETEVQRLSWGGSYLMGVSPLYIIFQSSSFEEYCASYALSFFQLKSLKY